MKTPTANTVRFEWHIDHGNVSLAQKNIPEDATLLPPDLICQIEEVVGAELKRVNAKCAYILIFTPERSLEIGNFQGKINRAISYLVAHPAYCTRGAQENVLGGAHVTGYFSVMSYARSMPSEAASS